MIAGLVLAAGAGTRLGQPKAPLVVGGERLVDRAVRILREGGCDDVIVVLGAWQGEVPNAKVVVNPTWETGMGSSLAAGLEVLLPRADVSSVVVTLVDLPRVTSNAVRAVIAHPGELVVGVYDGQSGHPLRLDRSHWRAILDSLEGDAGARTYLRDQSDVARVELGAMGDNADIDTAADLAEAQLRAHGDAG